MLACLPLGPCEAQSNNSAPAAQTQQQQAQPQPAPPPVAQQPEQKADTDYFSPRCDRPKNPQEDDLCQQRRMAQAAEDAVYWAARQTKIGIVGLIGVLLSLIFTGWAAWAAARGAKAAEKAIIIENRPWLKFSVGINGNPTINDYGMTFSCQMTLTNVGNGPAKIIGVTTGELDFFEEDLLGGLVQWIDEQMQIAHKHPREQETFFPSETYASQQYPRMSRDLFDKHVADIPDHKMVNPVIIFGVFYKAAIGTDIFYTAAAYNITMPDIERGRDRAIEIDKTGKVDGRLLAINRYPGLSRAI